MNVFERNDTYFKHESNVHRIPRSNVRNKNTPYIVVVVCQPTRFESDKLLWLENVEPLLSEVRTKCDGVIIITGDINIDLIGEQNE